jgi:hypothetical protein
MLALLCMIHAYEMSSRGGWRNFDGGSCLFPPARQPSSFVGCFPSKTCVESTRCKRSAWLPSWLMLWPFLNKQQHVSWVGTKMLELAVSEVSSSRSWKRGAK